MSINKNSIVSNDELNTMYQQMVDKSQSTTLNPYDTYILECKQRQIPRVSSQGNAIVYVEKHHIIPRFDNGPDTPEKKTLFF